MCYTGGGISGFIAFQVPVGENVESIYYELTSHNPEQLCF